MSRWSLVFVAFWALALTVRGTAPVSPPAIRVHLRVGGEDRAIVLRAAGPDRYDGSTNRPSAGAARLTVGWEGRVLEGGISIPHVPDRIESGPDPVA
ncbi:MAG: hypothetical protein GY778_23490, partial [bacterium]|nr:hypothetical protein [bacterium]